jgi:hypothetical protein
LSECRPWCPDWKAPGTALFFDDPKNNQGASFITGPLKFDRRTDGFTALQAKPQEGFATEGRHKNLDGRLPYSMNAMNTAIQALYLVMNSCEYRNQKSQLNLNLSMHLKEKFQKILPHRSNKDSASPTYQLQAFLLYEYQ